MALSNNSALLFLARETRVNWALAIALYMETWQAAWL